MVGDAITLAKTTSALRSALEERLGGENEDALLYDATWGGLVSSDGISDQGADFGNGW